MLLHGDPAFSQSLPDALAALSLRLSAAARRPDADTLRTLLIHAGQVEQGLSDAAQADPALGPLEALLIALTDYTAAASLSPPPFHLAHARDLLDQALAKAPALTLRIKLPEGFAFYTLYPEQYAAAARAWAAANPGARLGPVALIGIRSIGTSLSAVAAAALSAQGWHVRRTTIRPTGHPFERTASIDPAFLRGVHHALIIDEGPGLSGSSMAAAAKALLAAGLPMDRIAFLPGHKNPPGPAASPETSALWSTIQCYTAGHASTPLSPATLRATLAARTATLRHDCPATPEDLSSGRWRACAYSSTDHWPAVCDTLERSKLLFPAPGGQGILWKFAGLAIGPTGQTGAESALARLNFLAAGAWTSAPLDSSLGYIAIRWLPGRLLTPADATPETLGHIARYLTAAATETLSPDEQSASLDRLAEMLLVNTRETLGEPAARRAQQWGAAARRAFPSADIPAAGDGRPAPHKWLRTPEGHIYKLDAAGHDTDHTLIGPQPLIWDLAGVIVEWQLAPARAAALLAALGQAPNPALLTFHTAAYAAFRLAMLDLARVTADTEEFARIHAAAARYAAPLRTALSESPPEAGPTPAPPPPYCSRTTPTAHSPRSSRRSPTPG